MALKTFHFTKLFTKATLSFDVNERFEDEMTFVSHAAFLNWAKGINALNAKGKLPYRVVVPAEEPVSMSPATPMKKFAIKK